MYSGSVSQMVMNSMGPIPDVPVVSSGHCLGPISIHGSLLD
jgi:hypothetical protein